MWLSVGYFNEEGKKNKAGYMLYSVYPALAYV